jgi:hypothetical protein
MEHMRRAANMTVLRACGFASLAIFCVMVGTSVVPKVAFQTGGFLTTLLCAILMLKAYGARTKDHRRTEMWICLKKDQRPPAAYAQLVTATVLRETYLRFALWTSGISIALWSIALVLPVSLTLR